MLTYYQKRRVLAKIKRIKNHIKYQEFPYYPAEVIYLALTSLDRLICAHLDEPCAFVRTKGIS